MTRNRLWRDALIIIGIAVALLLYVFSSNALAQVAQPQYVRPSKGAPVNVFPGPEGRGLPANTATTASAVFDFSAFDAAQIAITFRDAGGTSCAGGFATWSVGVYGGPDKTAVPGPLTGAALPDPNAIKNENSFATQDQVYEVGYLPTFIAIYAATGALVAPFPASCRMLVTMIPKPFGNPARSFGDVSVGNKTPVLLSGGARPNIIGGSDYSTGFAQGNVYMLRVDSQGRITTTDVPPLPVSSTTNRGVIAASNVAPGTTIIPAVLNTNNYYTARVQNLGTNAVACVVGNVGATSTVNNCVMKAASGAASYDGGECTLFDVRESQRVQCASLGGAPSNVTVFQTIYVGR